MPLDLKEQVTPVGSNPDPDQDDASNRVSTLATMAIIAHGKGFALLNPRLVRRALGAFDALRAPQGAKGGAAGGGAAGGGPTAGGSPPFTSTFNKPANPPFTSPFFSKPVDVTVMKPGAGGRGFKGEVVRSTVVPTRTIGSAAPKALAAPTALGKGFPVKGGAGKGAVDVVSRAASVGKSKLAAGIKSAAGKRTAQAGAQLAAKGAALASGVATAATAVAGAAMAAGQALKSAASVLKRGFGGK